MRLSETPPAAMGRFTTQGGIAVTRRVREVGPDGALEDLACALDAERGLLIECGAEIPGRYAPFAIGFHSPPLVLTGRGRTFRIEALNGRGRILLPAFRAALETLDSVTLGAAGPDAVAGEVAEGGAVVAEEERSRQPSLFTVIRACLGAIGTKEDRHLGLYGAFGYDLAFQFEPIRLSLQRPDDQRDLVLYLPDELLVIDRRRGAGRVVSYEFELEGVSTAGLPRTGRASPYRLSTNAGAGCDHASGEYQAVVERAREAFARGDLFEAVPGQVFREPCAKQPSRVFRRLRRVNPAPYGALVNLGEGEFLVSASPEMFLRSDGRRIETCPISGTIRRGADAVGDADNIRALLNSAKDEAELTMCTDVDRNDKARICRPGSVRVIGRRQVEMYSRLIHTVDHVEGVLRDGFDALDAFLSHAWAVTVTGAPKRWAMQFLEDNERSGRRWYGGAFGALLADGAVDTGLTLRTIRLEGGVAEIRAGATLLIDSDPDAEEAETRLKAEALFAAVRGGAGLGAGLGAGAPTPAEDAPGADRRVLLVDHEDSFVHILSDYLRQGGAEVMVVRRGAVPAAIDRFAPDLVMLSPGPGRPSDFDLSGTIAAALGRGLPVFGVCLGLQGIVEHFGGELAVGEAVHGKASEIRVTGGRLFEGLDRGMRVGRYHSLHALRDRLPACLEVTAETPDGIVMAVEHRTLPIAAVQFHPESILTLGNGTGRRLIDAVLSRLVPVPPVPEGTMPEEVVAA
jgi:anthranilate synthase